VRAYKSTYVVRVHMLSETEINNRRLAERGGLLLHVTDPIQNAVVVGEILTAIRSASGAMPT